MIKMTEIGQMMREGKNFRLKRLKDSLPVRKLTEG